jgi:sugar/nucleoside kinase (ribokinase family)
MAGEEFDILCIGNALVDVYVRADGLAAARCGLAAPVQHIGIERLIETLRAFPERTMTAGGGAANAAKIAALLGAKACFQGALGTNGGGVPDEFGRFFTEDLAAAGVTLKTVLKPRPTGLFLKLSAGDESRIAASPSAAGELSENDIGAEGVEKAKVVAIDGFMWDRPGLVRHILRLAERYGKAAALDVGSVFIAGERAAEIAEYAARQPLILFMNAAEAAAFRNGLAARGPGAGEPENSGPRFEEICSYFESLTEGKEFPVIVVKLGEKGAVCFAGGAVYRAGTEPAIPGEPTGAGDAFCGAFLAAWARGKGLPECAGLGNRAARIVLGAAGTGVGRKQMEEAARLFERDYPLNAPA